MSFETTHTLVIGGGQAGIAMSEHLSDQGIAHIVLERDRLAEKWRTGRWDSLVANGPAWHDRFPNQTFEGVDPFAFAPKDRIVQYFEDYARRIKMPVRCGVTVEKVTLLADGQFRAETSAGVIEAQNLVCATGPFQKPIIPALVPNTAGIYQIHSADYKNPAQLPEGAVLVVGAGSSGVQIADELLRSGRKVFLAVGPHDRPPIRYRGRDFVWWLSVLGKWDMPVKEPGTEHVTIAVSGARGGRTVDFRELAARGMGLVGRANGFSDGKIKFANDLTKNVRDGDANYLSVLDQADAYLAANGIELPEDPQARVIPPLPEAILHPPVELDLAQEGIRSIIWATGYGLDYNWLDLPAFDEKGRPEHDKGVGNVPGLYFVGLSWLSCRASAFIWGAWRDAQRLAGEIAKRG
ncbi:NAD(P)/FAD-dependent oxidoreductase [Xinfangfangia sp. CPCC 101601]|uniref:NAD(P)/FAD-dependent oxidoreductase n=1 Tax=Pseudogemmobacter lacusdianii TaxID=3069608 RepID=A0ABU0VWQ7_9RHOB|nr:NAD(P)/FAD-dependent oxidoreductase [Xinfangfangia sp. CPCC 101601]MDQ2066187.1 NAD(P)/FAD-dependent oxidoreductase [Xinfangfangia sp. CPCC 101601]